MATTKGVRRNMDSKNLRHCVAVSSGIVNLFFFADCFFTFQKIHVTNTNPFALLCDSFPFIHSSIIGVVAFDAGGVVFFEGKTIGLKNLSEKYGYDIKKVEAVLTSPDSKLLRRGKISDEQFWNFAREQLPDYDIEAIKQEWFDGYQLDPQMKKVIDLIRKENPSMALALYTGNIKSRLEYLVWILFFLFFVSL